MLRLTLVYLLLPLFSISQEDTAFAYLYEEPISAGPMPGYTEMTEVAIWLQTKESRKVHLQYWVSVDVDEILQSETITTDISTAFSTKFILSDLLPGTSYTYKVFVDGHEVVLPQTPLKFKTQPLWQGRSNPPDFKVAIGSCTYINEKEVDRPGKPYGGNYEIFGHIQSQQPDMMLWLGDNIYLREVDWSTRSGIMHRYTHTRSTPEMQQLLSSTHHYAIWDDHDFGPNDANRSFVHKDETLRAFKLFWANNGYGIDSLPCITGQFTFRDIDFFLLDDRSFRTDHNVKTQEPQVLGQAQVDWLIEALKYSKAPFKMVAVGGQFLSNAALYENMASYKAERKQIIKRIKKENITGVIFLTGDRHHTELTKMDLGKNNVIYDLTCSPLTSTPYDHTNEPNKLRVEGTIVGERNFGILEFSGKLGERRLTIKIHNSAGELLWSKEIEQPKP